MFSSIELQSYSKSRAVSIDKAQVVKQKKNESFNCFRCVC